MSLPPVAHFWCEREEEYLELLHKTCLELAEVYRKLYVESSRIQNKLRLPAIILSSLSGAASFGASSFASSSADPTKTQGYISISIGIVNVFIATIQTYESFKKIADTVSKSISTCLALKKLSEDIHCMIFIPPGDRDTAGVMYLRDAFNRYQSIIDQAPALEFATKDHLRFKDVSQKINLEIRKQNRAIANSHFSATSVPFTQYNTKSSDSYNSTDDRDKKQVEFSIDIPMPR
jgi:hypothetical protein